MSTVTALDNPYWDAVKDHINPTGSLWRTPEVDWSAGVRRHDLVSRYSWTITDPVTVAFIAEHSGGRLVDPMAGTGYWGWVLAQLGVDVLNYDLKPPGPDHEDNHWHRNQAAHSSVAQLSVVDSVALHPNRTLMLSWPPYGFEGATVLDAYRGDRVIYVGETMGGCCGDDAMFEAFGDTYSDEPIVGAAWTKVAEHVPVQWLGMHDVVNVYERAS